MMFYFVLISHVQQMKLVDKRVAQIPKFPSLISDECVIEIQYEH